MSKERKCNLCKEKFPIEELVGFKDFYYCKDCLKIKQENAHFYDVICKTFCLMAPGPRILSYRKKLKDTYGFTDGAILEALKYAVEVLKLDLREPTIGFITPAMIKEAHKYYREQAQKNVMLANAAQNGTAVIEHKIAIQKKEELKPSVDWDSLLDD